jgi:hypothetical protein
MNLFVYFTQNAWFQPSQSQTLKKKFILLKCFSFNSFAKPNCPKNYTLHAKHSARMELPGASLAAQRSSSGALHGRAHCKLAAPRLCWVTLLAHCSPVRRRYLSAAAGATRPGRAGLLPPT